MDETKKLNKVSIIRTDMDVTYNVDGDVSIELSTSTDESTPDRFSILDVEQERSNGATSFDIDSINDLIDIIKDFKKRKKKFHETIS